MIRLCLLSTLSGILLACGTAWGMRGVESPGVEAGDEYRRGIVDCVRTCQAAGLPPRFLVRRDYTDVRCGSLAFTISNRGAR